MSYMHIPELHGDQTLLLFKECFALEKVHGTSAHVRWSQGRVTLSSGGASSAEFAKCFDAYVLAASFEALGHPEVTIYGEAYGGKMQGMRATYGDALRFIVFDVKVGGFWLAVPNAADVAAKLGLEFVPYERASTDVEVLTALRDKSSEVAVRRGIVEPRPREGVVLRPLREFLRNDGERVIAKYKAEAFRETATPREIDPEKQVRFDAAKDVAAEWVTPRRIEHVVGGLTRDGVAPDIRQTQDVIKATVEDVRRESGAEVSWSREVERAVGAEAARQFRRYLDAGIGKE